MLEVVNVPDEAEMRHLGAALGARWARGDVVLLTGPLGAGKTTLVRGVLEGLGFHGAVRSPTFNLIQTFETNPPIMHADLYRVASWQGIGIEEYLDSHLCLIEWPDRAAGMIKPELCWQISIEFDGDGRRVQVVKPDPK